MFRHQITATLQAIESAVIGASSDGIKRKKTHKIHKTPVRDNTKATFKLTSLAKEILLKKGLKGKLKFPLL